VIAPNTYPVGGAYASADTIRGWRVAIYFSAGSTRFSDRPITLRRAAVRARGRSGRVRSMPVAKVRGSLRGVPPRRQVCDERGGNERVCVPD
jgi:hypothetical protein